MWSTEQSHIIYFAVEHFTSEAKCQRDKNRGIFFFLSPNNGGNGLTKKENNRYKALHFVCE